MSVLADTRNIDDKYKWWLHQDIVDDLDKSRSGLELAFMNLDHDFNLSSGVRNANWFNVHSVSILGKKRWDKRGAVGTFNYLDMRHYLDAIEYINMLKRVGVRVVAAEITNDAIPLPNYEWAYHCSVLFGEEGLGLSEDVLNAVDDVVFIPQRGSVRSLNVAVTSGIVSYDYSMKMDLL